MDKKIEKIFENKLGYQEVQKIMIKNVSDGKVLTDINYSLLLFDSEFNIYKKDLETNSFTKVENPNFKAVLINIESYNAD